MTPTATQSGGQKKGWDDFFKVLSDGQRLYFPFSFTNIGEPIECADGNVVELDDKGNSEIGLGDSDTVGFLLKLEEDSFMIETAAHSGGCCAPPHGDYVEAGNCGEFDKPMEGFIGAFIRK